MAVYILQTISVFAVINTHSVEEINNDFSRVLSVLTGKRNLKVNKIRTMS